MVYHLYSGIVKLLPYSYSATGDHLDFTYVVGAITIRDYHQDGTTISSFVDVRFRYVLIPGGVHARTALSPPDYKDYRAVCQYYGNTGITKLITNHSIKSPETVQQRMWDYIGGETNAANSVATMLQDLSGLESKVDSDYDNVVRYLEEARNEVGKWRQAFIDLEKEIRI